MSDSILKQYLSHDDGLKLLKTIDSLNPSTIPNSKVSTIKDVSVAMGWGLKETWDLIDFAYRAGLVSFYGGLLSRKRVDITELGERICECATSKDIKEVLKSVEH